MGASIVFLSVIISAVYMHSCVAAVSDAEAESYLEKFGYIDANDASPIRKYVAASESGPLSLLLSSEETNHAKTKLRNAVTLFQEMSGLNTTGELDAPTRNQMTKPRCGVLDIQLITDAPNKWEKNYLTYEIQAYSNDLDQDSIRRALQEAFDIWGAATPLTFTFVQSNGDIKVKFGVRDHGDPWPFDGKGNVLAHATMPVDQMKGLLHFDDDESWTYKDVSKLKNQVYMDLLNVAVHEIGHTLGLEHSKDQHAIMSAYYRDPLDANGNYVQPVLAQDDIIRIQELYGSRQTTGTGQGTQDAFSNPVQNPKIDEQYDWLFPKIEWPNWNQWPVFPSWINKRESFNQRFNRHLDELLANSRRRGFFHKL